MRERSVVVAVAGAIGGATVAVVVAMACSDHRRKKAIAGGESDQRWT